MNQQLASRTMRTKEEFALKENVTIPTLDNWIYRHGLPIIQIGRRVYIDDSDFTAWLSEHKKVKGTRKQPIAIPETLPRISGKSKIAVKMQRIY